jgi:glyoxylase-like metal-dependent hydrolase (beta-lactamase superfamily II)
MSRATRIVEGIWALPSRIGRAYLADTDAGLVLFDTGGSGSARGILSALRSLGRDAESVQRIVLSHYHTDHIGGAKALRAATGAPTMAHARDADVIRGERPLPPLKREGRLRVIAPLFDRLSSFEACPVDVIFPDEIEEMPLGVADLRVVYTPGHTMGSVSLLVPGKRGALLGDTMFNFLGRLSLSWGIDTEDHAAAVQTAKRIAELDFDVACFGHGRIIRGNAADRVRAFVERLG